MSAVMASEFYWAVVSRGRADRVQPLHAALGTAASQVEWWVPEGQRDEYKTQGARLAPKLGSTSHAYALRGNGAMDPGKALQKFTIILADDVSRVTSVQQKQWSWTSSAGQKITILTAAKAIHASMEATRARLGGLPPCSNAYPRGGPHGQASWCATRKVTTSAFLRGDFLVVHPEAWQIKDTVVDACSSSAKHAGPLVRIFRSWRSSADTQELASSLSHVN